MAAWWHPKHLVVDSSTGNLSQTRVWANIGKGLIIWLLWKHADKIIEHGDALLICLALVILPETAKKIIEAKWGGKDGIAELK